ncbi:MAG: hypothetical protein GX927_06395, partial [Lentisphaerae bacterium]|nr:hypothetical protein [Lentisphaerota bacterium]
STRPAAKIALLLSAATRDLYKGEINDVTEETFQDGGFVAEFHGWSRALSENHLPYAVITEYELTPERLNAFDVLILPHAVCLPDLDFEKISCRILATGDTGLRGLDGMKRAKPLFASRLPLQQFDVQELLTLKHPLQVTNAPSSLLVRPVVSPDGMLVHLVTGSDVFEQEQWIFKAEGMTEGYLTSPSRPEAQPLRITDGEFYISPETIGQYALLILKR